MIANDSNPGGRRAADLGVQQHDNSNTNTNIYIYIYIYIHG